MKILALALLLALRPLAAHPHAWIDLRTAPRVVAGHIVAVDFQLELDPMQSLLMLWPLNRAADEQQRAERWAALVADVRQTLAKRGHYLHTDAPFTPTVELERAGDNLLIRLHIRLATPTKRFRYQLYEDSYYIEMLHNRERPRLFLPPPAAEASLNPGAAVAAAGCTLTITPSNPSETVIMTAYALDAGSTGPAQLGKEFAETGEIRCP